MSVEAIQKALEGVTPGPWQVITDEHDYQTKGNDHFPSRSGKHTERRIATTWMNPQAKDFDPVVTMSFGIGVDGGPAKPMVYITRDNARYIAAVNPATVSELISTLESLQRENEALKNLIDGDNCADPDKIDALFRRAEAAEAEAKRYRVALIAAKTRMRNCRGAIESDQVVDKDVHGSLQNGIRDIQDALASTGGEHHAE